MKNLASDSAIYFSCKYLVNQLAAESPNKFLAVSLQLKPNLSFTHGNQLVAIVTDGRLVLRRETLSKLMYSHPGLVKMSESDIKWLGQHFCLHLDKVAISFKVTFKLKRRKKFGDHREKNLKCSYFLHEHISICILELNYYAFAFVKMST